MVEIERKFLIISDGYKQEAIKTELITQGFLNRDPERTVRVRLINDTGYLTIKGITCEQGTTRFEWEKEIPQGDAKHLLKLCEDGVVEKIRYTVRSGEHLVEVDEFLGTNIGLVIAEIELNGVEEDYVKPSWLGSEVTGEPKYYNSQLSKNPYSSWKK
jgi:CYTH domain-containing protein